MRWHRRKTDTIISTPCHRQVFWKDTVVTVLKAGPKTVHCYRCFQAKLETWVHTMLQHFVSHLPPQALTGTNCKLGSVPLCPRQILEMQIQRAAEEMKAYVSPDPQEKKKAMRWACWARPASCLRDEWPFLLQQALITIKPVNLLPPFPCCCDDTPFIFNTWGEISLRNGCCTHVTNLPLVHCREVYMKNISEQELLGKVRKVCWASADLADSRTGQYLEIFLYSVKNMIWGHTG